MSISNRMASPAGSIHLKVCLSSLAPQHTAAQVPTLLASLPPPRPPRIHPQHTTKVLFLKVKTDLTTPAVSPPEAPTLCDQNKIHMCHGGPFDGPCPLLQDAAGPGALLTPDQPSLFTCQGSDVLPPITCLATAHL